MHARCGECSGSLIVSGALLRMGVAGALHAGQHVAAASTPQQIRSQDTLHLSGWPIEQGP